MDRLRMDRGIQGQAISTGLVTPAKCRGETLSSDREAPGLRTGSDSALEDEMRYKKSVDGLLEAQVPVSAGTLLVKQELPLTSGLVVGGVEKLADTCLQS